MKENCQKCAGKLSPPEEAYVCSYGCTFCGTCAEEMDCVCPNCQGKLGARAASGDEVIDFTDSPEDLTAI